MKTDLQARGFTLTPALRSAVEREVSDYAAQFSPSPRSLQVRLFDVNGRRGGLDKGCLAYAQMAGGRSVVVATDIDSDLYRSIPAAFAKLARATRSAIGRRRSLRRTALPGAPEPLLITA